MSDESPRLKALFVDGHSIIFAWDDLRALHARNTSMARDELCRRMTTYQDCMQQRVVIVFDGKGEKTQAVDRSSDDIQVIYSGKGKTADDVIERLVAQYSERYDLTVATADRAEMDTVMAFGAFCITPRTLLEYLDRAESQMASALVRLRKR
ncbi:MAG: putative RNA-binding protein with PIN domain [Verrucomicrobiales bacterium]|jgi:predicted RNA-binding protein with PIN domain